LVAKIAEYEKKINEEKVILGQLIQLKYIDDDMSMLEMMASSNNLHEFVEKEQYNVSVQDKIHETTDRIQALKKEQEGQKALTEQLLADNRAMQAQLTGEKQEVANLLAMNQQQQAQYTASISTTSVQITDLQRQQAEENLRFQREQARLAELARQKAAAQRANGQAPPPPVAAPAGVRPVNGRAYPYANAPWPNEISDPWGMYQRQCVSYTAWAVTASGRRMPYWGGRGNAKQWDDNARAAGIPVDGNPRPGDVGVRNAGTYGHVVYVDAVNGDGSITISQYNAAWTGTFSTARIFPGDMVFIHF
jgi:surface antigen